MKDLFNKLYKYFIVGIIGILVDNIAIIALEYLLGISPDIATLISAEVGNINNFIFNDKWTFKDRKSGAFWERILKYHISISVGFIVSRLILFPIFYNMFIAHTDKFISTLAANNISIFLSFIINFSLNILFTWGKKGGEVAIEDTELR